MPLDSYKNCFGQFELLPHSFQILNLVSHILNAPGSKGLEKYLLLST